MAFDAHIAWSKTVQWIVEGFGLIHEYILCKCWSGAGMQPDSFAQSEGMQLG